MNVGRGAGMVESGHSRSGGLRTLLEYGGVLLLAAPFFLLTAQNYLHLDLWFDEILSLENFILVPFKKTITDYSSTNNHIFFSILTRKALRLLGYRTLIPLLEEPWILRSLMLGVGTATILTAYAIGRRFFGKTCGAITAVILATTVPFYNFAVQVRGYTLSMCLLTLLLLFIWNLEEQPRRRYAVGVAVVTALLLYTTFVNLYVVAAVMTCQGVFLLGACIGRDSPSGASVRSRRKHLAIVLSCAAGLALAALLYAPFFSLLVGNRHLRQRPGFSPSILCETLPDIMRQLLSGRWALLAAVFFGAAALFRQTKTSGNPALLKKYLLLCAVLLLPFVFSFLRRDRIYERVFVNLAPVLALILALNCRLALSFVRTAPRAIPLVAVAVVWAYCSALFAAEVERKDRFLLEKIYAPVFEHKWATITANFYQARYRPRETVRLIKDFLARHRDPLPVFIAGQLDWQAMPRHFLANAGIEFQELRALPPREYPTYAEALFIVSQPLAFEGFVSRDLPGTWCLRLNAEVLLANVYYCRQAPREKRTATTSRAGPTPGSFAVSGPARERLRGAQRRVLYALRAAPRDGARFWCDGSARAVALWPRNRQ